MYQLHELFAFWMGCFFIFSVSCIILFFVLGHGLRIIERISERFNKFVFNKIADYFDDIKNDLNSVSPEIDYFITVMSKSLRTIKRPNLYGLKEKLKEIKNNGELTR